jgi:hypothetical protein
MYITTESQRQQYAAATEGSTASTDLTRYYYGYEQATFALLSNTNVDEERYGIEWRFGAHRRGDDSRVE